MPVICRDYGTGRLSGVEIDMSAGEIWGFQEGKVRSVTVFRDCEEAQSAADSGSARPEALEDPDRLRLYTGERDLRIGIGSIQQTRLDEHGAARLRPGRDQRILP